MSEIWKDIPNYQGLYQVSDYGNIRSLDHYSNNHYPDGNKQFHKGKILKPFENANGYLLIKLYKNGHNTTFQLHRIVANVFLPNHNKKLQVNHLDENTKNNKVTNLEWCSAKRNSNYGTRNKRISVANRNGKLSKKIKQLDKVGNLIKVWPSLQEAERHGFDHRNLSACALGKIKSAYGYKWKYAEAQS